jgi:hypothetical protein
MVRKKLKEKWKFGLVIELPVRHFVGHFYFLIQVEAECPTSCWSDSSLRTW